MNVDKEREGDNIVELASELQLQSMLVPGPITWEDYAGRSESTIDVVPASARLAEAISQCQVLETEHGSDHKSICIVAKLKQERLQFRLLALLFEKADWKQINEDLTAKLPYQLFPTATTKLPTKEQLDEGAELFHQIMYTRVLSTEIKD